MNIQAIQTHKIQPKESLLDILDKYIASLEEGCIVAITSKIISISQNRLVPKGSMDKTTLIYQEADKVLKTKHNPYGIYLTMKDGLFLPSAGIDESNVDNAYVLYPHNSQQSAQEIWLHLQRRHDVRHVGVVITDSRTTPLRGGVTGVALAWCGFQPLVSYVGKDDLYQRPLQFTQTNVVDALAVSAVFVMGEGNEQTPLAIIKQAPHVIFSETPPSAEEREGVVMSPEKDLYSPLFQGLIWE